MKNTKDNSNKITFSNNEKIEVTINNNFNFSNVIE